MGQVAHWRESVRRQRESRDAEIALQRAESDFARAFRDVDAFLRRQGAGYGAFIVPHESARLALTAAEDREFGPLYGFLTQCRERMDEAARQRDRLAATGPVEDPE